MFSKGSGESGRAFVSALGSDLRYVKRRILKQSAGPVKAHLAKEFARSESEVATEESIQGGHRGACPRGELRDVDALMEVGSSMLNQVNESRVGGWQLVVICLQRARYADCCDDQSPLIADGPFGDGTPFGDTVAICQEFTFANNRLSCPDDGFIICHEPFCKFRKIEVSIRFSDNGLFWQVDPKCEGRVDLKESQFAIFDPKKNPRKFIIERYQLIGKRF